jgi:hypothetical protein
MENSLKMKKMGSRTYEEEVLAVLVFESRHKDSERKLRRRLREKKLGPYEQDRIDALRAFKNDVARELGKLARSKFYAGLHGTHADLEDWDRVGLLRYMKERHSKVSHTVIGAFLPYAIFLYYLK